MSDTPVVGPVGAPRLQVMSFNIRRRLPHLSKRNPDRWERRAPLVRRLLGSELPALIGMQEALPDQEDVALAGLGDDYRSIGFGRNPGDEGERCPIFWNDRRLRLLEWNQTALSDTPEIPGSTTWGNKDPRIIVAGVFEDRMTGLEFLMVNTHFDHRSPKSRQRSAQVVRHLVAGSSRPAILTGDFNSDAGSKGYQALTSTGMLRDTWKVAEERLTESWGSFPNYRPPKHGRKRLDWILTTPSIEVLSAAINVMRFDGRYPSDHAPVQAVLELTPIGGGT